MNKIISIKLPILATLVMAMALTLSCTSDLEDLAKSSSSGGENSSSSNEQSSSSGIPNMCCRPCKEISGELQCLDVCSPPVLVGNEYVCAPPIPDISCPGGNPLVWTGTEYVCSIESCPDGDIVLFGDKYVCVIDLTKKGCCPHPSCYDCGSEPCVCPQVCWSPIFVGNEYACPVPNKSSSSVKSQSSSSVIPDICCLPSCYVNGECTAFRAPECEPPVLVGNGYVCPVGTLPTPNQSSSSSSAITKDKCGELGNGSCDDRDGKTYGVVKIGTQIWMAENLNYAAEGSKCGTDIACQPGVCSYTNYFELSDANTTICDKYGRLYDWNTAMKACPDGWHLPSKGEWRTLVNFVGGNKIAGKKLKAKSGWLFDNGTDDYYFSALPGGGTAQVGRGDNEFWFGNDGVEGIWWTATENSAIGAYYVDITDDDVDLGDHWGGAPKKSLYSVRCVGGNPQ